MSSFEKLFVTNELLRILASSSSLFEAFKKIFVALETHLKINGALIAIRNDKNNKYVALPKLCYKLSKFKVIKLINELTIDSINNTNSFDISKYTFIDPLNKEMSYIYFPFKLSSKTEALLLIYLPTSNISKIEIDTNLIEAISSPIAIMYERENIFNELQSQKNGFEFLHNLSNEINKTLDIETILRLSLKVICKTFENFVTVIVLTYSNCKVIAIGASKYFNIDESISKILLQIEENINETTKNYTIIKELPDESNNEFEKIIKINTESSIWLSLNYNNNINGYLGIFSHNNLLEITKQNTIKFLTLASHNIITAIENARLYNEVERLASIDGMTNVYNYRYFYTHLKTEIERSKRYLTPVSIIMIDIDHFKSFNDLYGHQAGDEVLRNVGKILNEEARKIDIVARYGGEEFIIVLPETNLFGALELAERIRDKIEKQTFLVTVRNESLMLKVTVSVGVSTFVSQLNINCDTLIKYADEALYHAKHSGRNIVCYNENGILKQFRRV